MSVLFQIALFIMAVFLILIILVQKGRGGGLAGALGGPGGSSAFGAKAGDTFTRITMYAAGIWILLCIFASMWGANRGNNFGGGGANAQPPAAEAEDPGTGDPAAVGGLGAGSGEADEVDDSDEQPEDPAE